MLHKHLILLCCRSTSLNVLNVQETRYVADTLGEVCKTLCMLLGSLKKVLNFEFLLSMVVYTLSFLFRFLSSLKCLVQRGPWLRLPLVSWSSQNLILRDSAQSSQMQYALYLTLCWHELKRWDQPKVGDSQREDFKYRGCGLFNKLIIMQYWSPQEVDPC
jgi:hypothetical protein